MFTKLFTNVRFYVLALSVLLSGFIYFAIANGVPAGSLRNSQLEQLYGFISIIYVYLALLATPLTKLFTSFHGRERYLHARRAIGVAAFYFAALHVYITFAKELGGFAGIKFLGNNYLVALVLGLVALLILLVMTVTSTDWAVKKLTFKRWKLLHRFVYIAGLAVLVHVAVIGTHFGQLNTFIPRLIEAAVIILLLLESIRFDRYVRSVWSAKWPALPTVYVPMVVLLGLGIGYGLSYLSSGSESATPLNIHAQHIALAKQAQNTGGGVSAATLNSAGTGATYAGDPTKRFTVSFEHSDMTAGQTGDLHFKIYDASNGSTNTNLAVLYSKYAHLVIVDESLQYYSHIHPQPTTSFSDLAVSTSFPTAGLYHLYLNYQPVGAIEQQVAFTVQVKATVTDGAQLTTGKVVVDSRVDTDLQKTFGNYKVKLLSSDYSASKMSIGEQQVQYSLYHSDGTPVTTLKPYLAAYGHLVMINTQTYDYIHVHPVSSQAPAPGQSSGPNVNFLPLGLYGPIKPGTYRVFAQFNPDDNLTLTTYTIRINP
jgi:DMSO/TMAO reductase YedYZ heme-binding membrane subunit